MSLTMLCLQYLSHLLLSTQVTSHRLMAASSHLSNSDTAAATHCPAALSHDQLPAASSHDQLPAASSHDQVVSEDGPAGNIEGKTISSAHLIY